MAYTKFKPLVYKYVFTEQIDVEDLPKYTKDYFTKGEKVISAFQTTDDYVAFTDRKILLFDKSGLTKKMKEVLTIPYKNITTCGVSFGMVKSRIYMTLNNAHPITLKFKRNIHKVIVKNTYISIINNLNT